MTEQIRANTLFHLDFIRIHLSASRLPGFLSDDVDSFLLPPRQLGRNKRLETVSEYEFVYCHKKHKLSENAQTNDGHLRSGSHNSYIKQ